MNASRTGRAWRSLRESDDSRYIGVAIREMLANAALFASLADLIGVYGEDAVAKMTTGLSRRIQHGEFTLKRTPQ